MQSRKGTYAGCKGIGRENRKEAKEYDIPAVGSMIVVNEQKWIKNWPFTVDIKTHGYRGCVMVESETRCLLICREYYNENVHHTVSFQKMDFKLGILQFVEVNEPLYKEDLKWKDYQIDNIAKSSQVAV